MSEKNEFMKKFHEEVSCIIQEKAVFRAGLTSFKDYMDRGHGDLVEGIRTTMRIGVLELFGTVEDTPLESTVQGDYFAVL